MERIIKIAKPLIWLLNELWKLWILFDDWWTKKSLVQKSRYRNGFIIICLVAIIIWQRVQNEVDRKITEKDHNNKLNNCIVELNTVKREDIDRMKLEIAEGKKDDELRKIAEKKADSALVVIAILKNK